MIHFTHDIVENLVGKKACSRCEACVCHPEKAELLLEPCPGPGYIQDIHDSHVLENVVLSKDELECIVCNACTCHNPTALGKECLQDG